MIELDPGSELRMNVFQYLDDHDGFLTHDKWKKYDGDSALQLDTFLSTQWITQGFIRPNEEKGGFELTAMGEDELDRLNKLKYGNPQDQTG